MDFLVHAPKRSLTLLIEVKGKQFPYINKGNRVYWENWIGEEDLSSLYIWSRFLGSSSIPLILFMYWIHDHRDEIHFSTIHTFRDRTYGLVAVLLDDYHNHARVRSRRWRALDISRGPFREICKPFSYYIDSGLEKKAKPPWSIPTKEEE